MRQTGGTLPDSPIKESIRPFYLKWLYFPLHPQAKPQQWKDCWTYPEAPLTRALPPGSRQPDILFLPMNDWHTRMQRPQHFARSLAKLGHRCFYLNPNLGRQFPHPVLLGRGPHVRQVEERIWELHIGLPREPVFHHRLLTAEESRSIVRDFQAIARSLGISHLAILCQFPLWNSVGAALREAFQAPILYDCHDLLSGFSRIAPEIIAAENQLFEQADVVVFSAKSLLEQKLKEMPWLGEKARLVRNGVDVSHFHPVSGEQRKIVGYVGALDEWFDVESVRAAAQSQPDCTFVFLGRIEDKKVLALEALPNVRFYGEVPYSRIAVYMAEFAVALIPFLVTPLTLATNPIKLYEYFSCGLPVVSSRLPEVAEFGELVYLADSPRSFAEQVGRALEEREPALRQRRREVAEGESWEARGRELSGMVGKV